MDDSLEKVLKIMETLRSMHTDALARLPTPVRADFHLLLQRWVYVSAQDLTFEEENERPLMPHFDVFTDDPIKWRTQMNAMIDRYRQSKEDNTEGAE